VGKSRPTASDPPLKAIAALERRNVIRACVLLRLARALSLGRKNAVKAVRIQLQPARLLLQIRAKRGGSPELEIWAVENERRYFREVFGRELVVDAA